MRTFLWIIIGTMGILALAFAAGFRVVVISPTSEFPAGGALVVRDAPSVLLPIDSVETYCERCLSFSVACKTSQFKYLRESSHAVFELPYSQVLFYLSGADVARWQQMEEPQADNVGPQIAHF